MDIKKDKQLIQEAINHGCTTAAELARFVKIHALAAKNCPKV